jgi:type VII secretion integral membrane protein EccD
MLSASDPGLRRVCVHAGTVTVDLALPAAVPVATLIPSIIDVLDDLAAFATASGRFRLSRPGLPALPPSTTLAQNDIRDGAVLLLTRGVADIPAPDQDDVTEAVSATLDTGAPSWDRHASRLAGAVAAGCLTGVGCLALVRNAPNNDIAGAVIAAAGACLALAAGALAYRAHRDPIEGLTLGIVAAAFAAVAGLLAVPGPPGFPHLLLAAMSAAVTSVLAIRVTGCGVVTLTALACFSVTAAAAALAGAFTNAPPHVIGSASALLSLGLLEAAPRLSIALSGLSPHSPTDLAAKVIRADNWLTSLLAAFAGSAATGAIVTALARGAPRPGGVTLSVLTCALLLLRAHSHIEVRRRPVFVLTGTATAGATLAALAASPGRGPWIAAATALMAAAALYLGFVAPSRSLSPVARRGVEVLECLTLTALAPLTCWICGVFGAVRGLDLL